MLNLFLALIAATDVLAETPFWKAKEKVYARVQNREIIVSVKAVEKADSRFKHELSMSGGGQADAPCSSMFKISQDFVPIAKSSGYLDEISWDAGEKKMRARIKAYGYNAKIVMKLQPTEPEGADPYLAYEVTKGPMEGMTGRFTFSQAGSKKCDVGMHGTYGYDEFPIPQFFLRFGMEVMFQRMASRMRVFAEEQYGKKP